ncbi:hypothetical protein, partial [Chryseobacterium sp.]|uniref:hypothetical protein n=1 Tax=Chryseobacterium sp. TaxID=1871047 RepID=UPI0035C67CD6
SERKSGFPGGPGSRPEIPSPMGRSRGSKYFKFLKIFIISKNLKYLRSFRKDRSSVPFPQVKISHFDTPRKWQSFCGPRCARQNVAISKNEGSGIFEIDL